MDDQPTKKADEPTSSPSLSGAFHTRLSARYHSADLPGRISRGNGCLITAAWKTKFDEVPDWASKRHSATKQPGCFPSRTAAFRLVRPGTTNQAPGVP